MSLSEILEKVYMIRHLQEMAELDVIETPEKYILFNFTREYQFETPHMNLGKNGFSVLAKIEIPPEKPATIEDFDILWTKKKFIFTSKLKRKILEWYQNSDEMGVNNWTRAMSAWKASMRVHQKS